MALRCGMRGARAGGRLRSGHGPRAPAAGRGRLALTLAVLVAGSLPQAARGAAVPPAAPPAGAPAAAEAGGPDVPVAGAWRQVHAALAGLEAREKATLAGLVQLDEAVRRAEERLAAAEARHEAARAELAAASRQAGAARAMHRERQEQAARLLGLVQYMGPGSYLQVLVGAEDWADFNRRLGAIVVTLRSARAALASLRASAADLERREALVARRAAELAQAARQEAEEAARLRAARARQEQALAALGEERSAYEARLRAIRSLWVRDARPYLERVGRVLERLARDGRPVPGTEVQLGPAGPRLRVPLRGLNERMAAEPDLQGLQFRAAAGAVALEVPGRALRFEGSFAVHGGSTLVYEVRRGDLAGVALDPAMIREALGGSGLALDLRPALGGWAVRSVELDGEDLVFSLAPGG